MKELYDMHCHIVPGVDDGACDMKMSVRMLQKEYEDGRKFDSLFSSNTSQSLYWLYFFVKIKLYLYTLHYVVV